MTVPVSHPGWPTPEWHVEAFSNGRVALRIIERRIETGMLDMTPDQARELAAALVRTADTAESCGIL